MLTKDAIVEGVHFLREDPPEAVARKLLRVNLSDLAAKAAEPFGYLLAVAWPERWDAGARAAFAEGLARDQAEFGIVLLGGDTVSTPGPMTGSVTALGYVPEGRAVRRSGARPGDRVFVSGPIGDGWLGLHAARGSPEFTDSEREHLADRYRLPRPRLDLRPALLEHASACADISDGLVADLGHVARASGTAAVLRLESLPLSAAAAAWLDRRSDRAEALVRLATGGDDYELVFTSAGEPPPGCTVVGEIVEGEGVRVLHESREIPIERPGWSHG